MAALEKNATLCKFALKGTCMNGKQCPFRHVERIDVLPTAASREFFNSTDPTGPALVVCTYFSKAHGSMCRFGEACRFAHVDNDTAMAKVVRPSARSAAVRSLSSLASACLHEEQRRGDRLPASMLLGSCQSVESLDKVDRIGEGTYGIVYSARERSTGLLYALKRVRGEVERDGLSITALREIAVLRRLSHANIVQLRGVFVGGASNIFLGFECIDHDLAALVDDASARFTQAQVKRLFIQLVQAVGRVHDCFLIHRDIKLANLLYSNDGMLRLADFGLAREIGLPVRPFTPHVVTLWYRAPELLLGASHYGTAVDMWAVGCVLAELLLSAPVMPGTSDAEQMRLIADLLGSPTEDVWPGCTSLPRAAAVLSALPVQRFNRIRSTFPDLSLAGVDLLKGLLAYDPRERMTAHDALQHPYLYEEPLPCPVELMPAFPVLASRSAAAGRKRRRSLSPDQGQGQQPGGPVQRFDARRMGSLFGPPSPPPGKRAKRGNN